MARTPLHLGRRPDFRNRAPEPAAFSSSPARSGAKEAGVLRTRDGTDPSYYKAAGLPCRVKPRGLESPLASANLGSFAARLGTQDPKMIFTSYRQQKVEGVFDTVVIGSGMGGLTVASLLARHAGKRVLILERHYTAGGFTHVFRRPGYEWDVGVHYIGQVNDPKSPVRAAYDYLTDGQLSWEPMPDVYDRLVLGDREYEFLSDEQRFRARVLAGLGCSQELAGVLTGQWGDYGSPAGRSSFGVHALIAEHY